jgi:DNA-binding CsgD family transcriptional regulator
MKQRKTEREAPEPAVIRQFHWPASTPRQQGTKQVRKSTTRKSWTKEEDALLKKHYSKQGSKYTAELLGRSITSVQHRALKLGVPGFGIRPWTSKEEHYLRKYYGKLTALEICRILRRSEQSVRGHIHQLGLGSYRPVAWTKDEVEYLRKHYGRVKVSVLAAELGRTPDAVELKAGKLGLRKKLVKLTDRQVRWIVKNLGKISYDNMARELGVSSTTIMKIAAQNGYRPRPNIRSWTPEEDAYLRENYGTKTRREIADALDRTIPLVGWRAAKLGLTREFRNMDKARPWTRGDDALLRKLFGELTYEEIARRLDRTRAAVVGRAVRLGLSKRGAKKEGETASSNGAGDRRGADGASLNILDGMRRRASEGRIPDPWIPGT